MNQLSECTQPWFELQIEYNARAGFCCYYKHNRQEIDIHGRLDIPQIWNSPPFQTARSIIKNNKSSGTGCEDCQNLRYPPLISFLNIPNTGLNEGQRQNWMRAINNFAEKRQVVDSLPVRYYINFGLACNISCIMCSQRDFHRQYKEHLSADILYSHKEYLKVANEIIVIGGEPLYIPAAREFISRLVNDPDFDSVLLTIVTNGTLLAEYYDLFKSHRRVNLYVSLDSAGATYNTIRRGSDWERVSNTLVHIKNEARLLDREWNVFASSVVMKNSLQNIREFITWCIKYDIRCFFVPLYGMDFTADQDIFKYPELLESIPDWRETLISSVNLLAEKGWDLGGAKSLKSIFYDLHSCLHKNSTGNSPAIREVSRSDDNVASVNRYALSIVVGARNDNYCGDFKSRFRGFTASLSDQCALFQREVELVVVEWNPIPDRKLLVEELDFAISDRLHIRFVEVPHSIHIQIPNHDKTAMFEYIAKNVGVARCSSDFILVTNPDVLFGNELFSEITSGKLSRTHFYRANRFDVYCDDMVNMPHAERMRFVSENAFRVNAPNGTFALDELDVSEKMAAAKGKIHENAAGDFFLMSKEHWLELRAYPEMPTSTFVDGLICYMASTSGLQQQVFDAPLFHQEHDRGDHVSRPRIAYEEYVEQCRKMQAAGTPTILNGPGWGLQQVNLLEFSYRDREFTDKAGMWLTSVKELEKRPLYMDQTVRSLLELRTIADSFRPTVIIEIGTSSGMSLRTWLSSDCEKIVAVDLSFQHLQASHQVIPVVTDRLTLVESDIMELDISRFWNATDRVLVFVDAHDVPGVPIMEKLLYHVFPSLPENNRIVVDDLWYSPKLLTCDTIGAFFDQVVLHEVDGTQAFSGKAAHYWEGGSFFGFDEVIPLMAWANSSQIELFHFFGKTVSFRFPPAVHGDRPTMLPAHLWCSIEYVPAAN